VLLHYIGKQETRKLRLFAARFLQKHKKHITNYHLVTAESPVTVNMIDSVHQTGPKKGA